MSPLLLPCVDAEATRVKKTGTKSRRKAFFIFIIYTHGGAWEESVLTCVALDKRVSRREVCDLRGMEIAAFFLGGFGHHYVLP